MEFDEARDARLMTIDEVASFLGISRREVLQIPIRQLKVDSEIRFRLRDIYDMREIDDPNSHWDDVDEGW